MRSGGPRHDSLDNVHYGLHYGVVCQNKDDEQKLGRVKVKFAWLDSHDEQTHWAQLVTPMEGNKFRLVQPAREINDVVLVAFIQGDFRQPVIVGGMWSGDDGQPRRSRMRTARTTSRGYRSGRAGHRLILDDTAKTKVVVTDKSGKLMVGIGNFAKDGAGPNTCAVFKPPMAGDVGISFTSKEGNVEDHVQERRAQGQRGQDSVKVNVLTTIEVTAGSDMSVDGSSATKLTAGSPTSLDAPKIDIG